MTALEITTAILSALIVFIALYLSIRTNLLRAHGSLHSKPPYSFSKVQFLWWTVIVGVGFLILYEKTENYNSFNLSII